jgi:hypothetical protein
MASPKLQSTTSGAPLLDSPAEKEEESLLVMVTLPPGLAPPMVRDHAVLLAAIFHRSRRNFIFLVGAAHDDLKRVIGQWSLQRLRLVPCARIQTSRSSSVVRITGIAFGWIGSTTAFGEVVKNRKRGEGRRWVST